MRWLCGFVVLVILAMATCAKANAGTITGNIQTATGAGVTNGTLGFTLSQSAVLSGTATPVTQTSSCYTSTGGAVVGLPDPLVLPSTSTNTASGTLPSGTYYVQLWYVNGSSHSLAGPEQVVVLGALGTVNVNPLGFQPSAASGYAVAIGSTSGGETLQGTVTGWTQYQQSTPLVTGTAIPSSNNSTCQLAFSDTLVPTGTFYTVSLINQNGSPVAGFPQTWCTYGGLSGTINISNGAPTGNCSTAGVFYPTPLFANGFLTQSIGGNLNVSGNLGVKGVTSVSALNSVVMADQQPGADASIKLNNCITAAMNSTGICDARGLSGPQTLSQPVQCGNHASLLPVTVLLPMAAVWTVTVPTGIGIELFNGCSFIGTGGLPPGSSEMVISPGAGTTMTALISSEPNPTSGGSYIRAEGFQIYNASTVTFSDAAMVWRNIYDASVIRSVFVANYNGVGLHISGACCASSIERLTILGNSGANAQPLLIDLAYGVSTAISCVNCSIDQPGAGKSNIVIVGGTTPATAGSVTFYNLYMEGTNAADTTTPMVSISGGSRVSLFGATAMRRKTGSTAYVFDVSNAVFPTLFQVQGFGFVNDSGANTYTTGGEAVNDHIKGLTVRSDTNGILAQYPVAPLEFAQVDLAAQTAAITTTPLYAVPATGAGQYRLSWDAKVTTAATTSCQLGALTIVYTDPDGVVQTITAAAQIPAGTIATNSTLNTTANVLLGLPMMLNVKAATQITYAFAYTSVGATAMQYNLHIRLEAL